MNWNRALSGLLAALYVVYACTHFKAGAAIKFSAGLLFPLVCIWFSEAIGSYTGWLDRGITNSSPPILVCILGWMLLLLPFLIWVVYTVASS